MDWFELDLGVVVGGERVDIGEPLCRLIAALDAAAGGEAAFGDDEEVFYLPISDGRYLPMRVGRLKPMVEALRELLAGGMGSGDGRLRLGAGDAVALAAFEEVAGANWLGGSALREMGRKLRDGGNVPAVRPPAGFLAEMRPYQVDGLSWMNFLAGMGVGGILADDMGLGKTVQALALVALWKAEGRLEDPVLVVAPTSLMHNWRKEAARFAPELKVLILQGSDRKGRFDAIGDSDVVLTTYPLLTRDKDVVASRRWSLMFLDEAQTVKNPDAASTAMVRGMSARARFALTGTPMENHLGELWSVFGIVFPGFLGDRKWFAANYRVPIEKNGDAGRARMLARRVRPFMLRRTKGEVASELPPKTEIVERIDMDVPQRDLYEAVRLAMHERVRAAIAAQGLNRSHIVVLDALLKMRQTCCDPRLLKGVKAAEQAGSAKLERLEELLVELVAEKRKILVFSQFTSMLELIRQRLDHLGIGYSLLTGDTRDRPAQIEAFQKGEKDVFLISLKAGGMGLNLTEADTVILYDPWWNPAVEAQAMDRAHRIGQDKPVFVYKFVVNGTIEEKMEELKERKRALAESLFDEMNTPTMSMTEADIDMLFSEADALEVA
jgi:SNF2 family DNA or RNA helicase